MVVPFTLARKVKKDAGKYGLYSQHNYNLDTEGSDVELANAMVKIPSKAGTITCESRR
jgi:hypothetical protein